MAGNSYGRNFRITTFGESHGHALGVIVDGCPAGLHIDTQYIQKQLNKRRPGLKPFETPRHEKDTVEIVSGIFEGKTLGTPITMIVRNNDHNSNDYKHLKNTFRTGHADYTYHLKYNHRDHRGGGRSSARETIGRVAGGAIALKILAQHGVSICGYVVAVGEARATIDPTKGAHMVDFDFVHSDQNTIKAPLPHNYNAMITALEQACQNGHSIGGVVEVSIAGLEGGVGEPVFRKLNSQLAGAIMSIPAVTGVEFGLGFQFGHMTSSDVDTLISKANNTGKANKTGDNPPSPPSIYGGIQGGISNGETITLRYSIKAPSSLLKENATLSNASTDASTTDANTTDANTTDANTTDANTMDANTNVEIGGRHDCFVGSRSIVIAESMVALSVLDLLMEYHGYKHHGYKHHGYKHHGREHHGREHHGREHHTDR